MDKLLKPERFDIDPNSPESSQEWTHWMVTFENFLSSVEQLSEADKLKLFTNHMSYSTFKYITNYKSYKDALDALKAIYIKPTNEIFARYQLTTRKQQPGESVDQYIQALILLSRECAFKSVSADENKNDYIRDALLSGLNLPHIRQRLLEDNTLKLQEAINQAQVLESAQKHSEVQCMQSNNVISAAPTEIEDSEIQQSFNPLTPVKKKSKL